MTSHDVYLTTQQIDSLVSRLAKQISAHYQRTLAENESVLVVVTLKGALFFAADLIRKLDFPVQLDFVRLTSYGEGTQSSGQVAMNKDIEHSPAGRHVLVLDEIVDSGRTLAFLLKHIEAAGPQSLKLCSLLTKPSRREVPVNVDFVGQEVEDAFLVGYGLDHGEKYRNLPAIHRLHERAITP